MNNKQYFGDIFCDPQKVFDCESHKILLNKLDFLWNRRYIKKNSKLLFNWYASKVVFGHSSDSNNISKWQTIKCEVLQSSVLGPLLFFYFI
jgi:hypothetical protein